MRGWEFWRLDSVDGGQLAWLGITRPGARSAIDRTKVWTLVPALRMFIANWFVTEDHARESGLWVHDNIHISEACDLVGEVPEVSKENLDRIVRPERCLQRQRRHAHAPEVAPAATINAANRLSPPRPDRSQWP